MDLLCVTVQNYCVGIGCRCFVFVPLLFTMFPTIDQVTTTVPFGVYWCFLLSCIVVIMIMIMIMIISIAFFFLFLFLSLYNYYLFWTYFHFICLLLNLFLTIYSVGTFVNIFFAGTFVWLFGCCLSIGC